MVVDYFNQGLDALLALQAPKSEEIFHSLQQRLFHAQTFPYRECPLPPKRTWLKYAAILALGSLFAGAVNGDSSSLLVAVAVCFGLAAVIIILNCLCCDYIPVKCGLKQGPAKCESMPECCGSEIGATPQPHMPSQIAKDETGDSPQPPMPSQIAKDATGTLPSHRRSTLLVKIGFVSFFLTQPEALLRKLQNQSDPLSLYLYKKLPSVQEHSVGLPKKDDWHEEVMVDLRKILRGEALYDASRFAHVRLSRKTSQMVDKYTQSLVSPGVEKAFTQAQQTLLNCHLLAEAYPSEIMIAQGGKPAASGGDCCDGPCNPPGGCDLSCCNCGDLCKHSGHSSHPDPDKCCDCAGQGCGNCGGGDGGADCGGCGECVGVCDVCGACCECAGNCNC